MTQDLAEIPTEKGGGGIPVTPKSFLGIPIDPAPSRVVPPATTKCPAK